MTTYGLFVKIYRPLHEKHQCECLFSFTHIKILTDMKNIFATKTVILGLVEVVRMEIESKEKRLSINDNDLVLKILDKVDADKRDFTTEKQQLCYMYSVTREIVWYEANTEESDEIIFQLKSGDRLFAQKFFYGTNPLGCNISRLRSKILSYIRHTYNVDVSIAEFGDIVYTFLWNNGTWSVLDKYSRKSSFFCWLTEVVKHELMRYLEDMRIINVNRVRTVGNTRLLGTSVRAEMWEHIISDVMPKGEHRDILTALLVERKTELEIMKEFGLDTYSLRQLQKRAEADLKDRLIRSDSGYEELVLRDRSSHAVEISGESVNGAIRWQRAENDVNPLAEILDVDLSKEDLQEKIVALLYSIPKKLEWSDEDRLVWTLRFIENTSPVEVAKRVGRKRSWVDTRYSRLNVRFNKVVKNWWAKNA